jgi:hypothetical protein
MPAGRPTVLTPEVIRILEEAFLIGCTDEEACFKANISTTPFYEYQKEHPEFKERKEALKQSPFYTARKSVVDNLEKDPDFALKYLERKKKDEFSTQVNNKHSGDPENPIQHKHTVTPEEALKERGIPVPGVELEDVE